MSYQTKKMGRREFLKVISGSVAGLYLCNVTTEAAASNGKKPNILWISTEDISPDLGCYGDDYAVTPNIDKLATESVRYENVFSHSGVCAPTRSGIITGIYPTTNGTHHMRCKGVPSAQVKCFSEYLRKAGYYCTNNVKTDYQFDPPPTAWDECSRKAHWRNRQQGQPFFAIFNFTTTHESQIRNRSKAMLDRLASLESHEKHDPAKAKLPPYYPDTPLVRQDWAQYYDIITLMDKQVADLLDQLQKDGLAEDTIVWFWGDHGRGLPRAKRWIYDSGLRVPLIIRVPEKWRKTAMPTNADAVKPGTVNDDLIAFIDFAPTMLSLAGIEIPKHIQGKAFLGGRKASPRDYIYAARDRMDEAIDLIRAVRDKRYKYIRNYMWHLSRGQDISYMNQMPTMQEMRRLFAEGKLKGPQMQYFEPTKPVEELYDIVKDPHEVENLATDPKYKNALERMRKVHVQWVKETGDIGLIPEPEFDELKRPNGQWQKTATPKFDVKHNNDRTAGYISINSATAGASITYRISNKGSWMLYTDPVKLNVGQSLSVKVCRIGYRDSNQARLTLTTNSFQVDVEGAESNSEPVTHWRDRIEKTDILERLRAIKQFDGQGEKAVADYMRALSDKYASVRYWAVVGLHTSVKSATKRNALILALMKVLNDPAPLVRAAAAETLYDWGHQQQTLPTLIGVLECKQAKARLYAMHALEQMGEKARPATKQIEAVLKDPDDYVKRVARTVLEQLKRK